MKTPCEEEKTFPEKPHVSQTSECSSLQRLIQLSHERNSISFQVLTLFLSLIFSALWIVPISFYRGLLTSEDYTSALTFAITIFCIGLSSWFLGHAGDPSTICIHGLHAAVAVRMLTIPATAFTVITMPTRSSVRSLMALLFTQVECTIFWNVVMTATLCWRASEILQICGDEVNSDGSIFYFFVQEISVCCCSSFHGYMFQKKISKASDVQLQHELMLRRAAFSVIGVLADAQMFLSRSLTLNAPSAKLAHFLGLDENSTGLASLEGTCFLDFVAPSDRVRLENFLETASGQSFGTRSLTIDMLRPSGESFAVRLFHSLMNDVDMSVGHLVALQLSPKDDVENKDATAMDISDVADAAQDVVAKPTKELKPSSRNFELLQENLRAHLRRIQEEGKERRFPNRLLSDLGSAGSAASSGCEIPGLGSIYATVDPESPDLTISEMVIRFSQPGVQGPRLKSWIVRAQWNNFRKWCDTGIGLAISSAQRGVVERPEAFSNVALHLPQGGKMTARQASLYTLARSPESGLMLSTFEFTGPFLYGERGIRKNSRKGGSAVETIEEDAVDEA